MPKIVPVIVTEPDGTEHRFSSVKEAGQFLGIPGGRVSNLCVMGYSVNGCRVRYESKNKQGLLMEGGEDDG